MDSIQKVRIFNYSDTNNFLNKSLEFYLGGKIINLLKTQYSLLQSGEIR